MGESGRLYIRVGWQMLFAGAVTALIVISPVFGPRHAPNYQSALFEAAVFILFFLIWMMIILIHKSAAERLSKQS